MKARKEIITVEWRGGSTSAYKRSYTEVKAVPTSKSRPAYAMHGSRRCGGLPILRRTEKAYSAIEWRMRQGGSHV